MAVTAGAYEDADLRSSRRAQTRRDIISSMLEMLADENPTTISMPAVAERAGVSVRTLYRYFPDKDSLMQAAATWFDDRARDFLDDEVSLSSLATYLEELWVELAANLPGVYAQLTGGPGRDLRRRRLARARTYVRDGIGPQVPDDRRDELVDMIIAVTSSSMLVELVDRMGYRPEHAAAMALRLVELLLADATTSGVPDVIPPPNTPQEGDGP